MSHIPTAAMPKAKTHEQGDTPATTPSPRRRTADLADRAIDAVKRNRTAAIAIGATLVAGIAAAAAAPAFLAREKPKPRKKPSARSRKKNDG